MCNHVSKDQTDICHFKTFSQLFGVWAGPRLDFLHSELVLILLEYSPCCGYNCSMIYSLQTRADRQHLRPSVAPSSFFSWLSVHSGITETVAAFLSACHHWGHSHFVCINFIGIVMGQNRSGVPLLCSVSYIKQCLPSFTVTLRDRYRYRTVIHTHHR